MASPSERRAAQRQLAREIRTGTFQPSAAGARARSAAANARIVSDIVAMKTRVEGGGDKATQDKYREVVARDAETGKQHTREQLEQIREFYRNIGSGMTAKQVYDLAAETFGDDFDDVKSAFYYH